jgi:hypothetical protein
MALTVRTRRKFTNGWKGSKRKEKCAEDVCSEGPSAVTCFEIKERIDERIRYNRRIRTYKIASQINIVIEENVQ